MTAVEMPETPAAGTKLSNADWRAALRCPQCRCALEEAADAFHCSGEACRARYPIVDGVPVLINESNSLFSNSDFASRRGTTHPRPPRIERAFSKVIPILGKNLRAEDVCGRLVELLDREPGAARVLVVGCGESGAGSRALLFSPNVEVVQTDVSLGDAVQLVCDAHDLPFADGYFDAVVTQAVLEHVVDAQRCAAEIARVVRLGGFVYSDTPFMQQVHGGPYDFARFTHLGHRRLFRCFEEIESGATAGAGTALAWSYQYFLLSFVEGRVARYGVKAFARLTAFWLRYLDRLMLEKPGSFDAASGYYFLGRKSAATLSDRELIKLYRGADNPAG